MAPIRPPQGVDRPTLVDSDGRTYLLEESSWRDTPPPAALPVASHVNDLMRWFKGQINTEGASCGKAGAYLGFRVFSYTLIPLVVNVISLVVSLIFAILTLPTLCCGTETNVWCWKRVAGSGVGIVRSLWDLTYDLRWLTGCCCPPDSAYLRA